MKDELREQLALCYSGVVHDMMRARGMRNFTLPPRLRPLIEGQTLCGPVFTIEGRVDDTADAHETLLEWTGLLSKAKPGHIWVSQPHDQVIAHMGELSAETLKNKGVLGAVVDGGVRDVSFLKNMEFQVWNSFLTPRDIVGRWLPTGFDVPIIIGEVLIEPGDYLLGDLDGIVRIPKKLVAEITQESIAAMDTENKVRTAILSGEDPQKAYLKYGKF